MIHNVTRFRQSTEGKASSHQIASPTTPDNNKPSVYGYLTTSLLFHHPLITHLQAHHRKLSFSWQKIYERFEAVYSHTYCISKKAHFDCLPKEWVNEEKVVDGARIKWCIPLLLDGMITFLQDNYFDLSFRRAFNQAKILLDCFLEELKEAQSDIYDLIMQTATFRRKKTPFPMISNTIITSGSRSGSEHGQNADSHHHANMSTDLDTPVPRNTPTMTPTSSASKSTNEDILSYLRQFIEVEDVHFPWNGEGKGLYDCLLSHPTNKSKLKYMHIIRALLQNPVFLMDPFSLPSPGISSSTQVQNDCVSSGEGEQPVFVNWNMQKVMVLVISKALLIFLQYEDKVCQMITAASTSSPFPSIPSHSSIHALQYNIQPGNTLGSDVYHTLKKCNVQYYGEQQQQQQHSAQAVDGHPIPMIQPLAPYLPARRDPNTAITNIPEAVPMRTDKDTRKRSLSYDSASSQQQQHLQQSQEVVVKMKKLSKHSYVSIHHQPYDGGMHDQQRSVCNPMMMMHPEEHEMSPVEAQPHAQTQAQSTAGSQEPASPFRNMMTMFFAQPSAADPMTVVSEAVSPLGEDEMVLPSIHTLSMHAVTPMSTASTNPWPVVQYPSSHNNTMILPSCPDHISRTNSWNSHTSTLSSHSTQSMVTEDGAKLQYPLSMQYTNTHTNNNSSGPVYASYVSSPSPNAMMHHSNHLPPPTTTPSVPSINYSTYSNLSSPASSPVTITSQSTTCSSHPNTPAPPVDTRLTSSSRHGSHRSSSIGTVLTPSQVLQHPQQQRPSHAIRPYPPFHHSPLPHGSAAYPATSMHPTASSTTVYDSENILSSPMIRSPSTEERKHLLGEERHTTSGPESGHVRRRSMGIAEEEEETQQLQRVKSAEEVLHPSMTIGGGIEDEWWLPWSLQQQLLFQSPTNATGLAERKLSLFSFPSHDLLHDDIEDSEEEEEDEYEEDVGME